MAEWKRVRLGEISKDGGHYGIGAPAVQYSDSLPTYLRITDIRDDGTIIKEGLKSVDSDGVDEYYLKPNDIVIARTGASTGRNYFYDGRDGALVYAGFLIRFSIDEEKIWPPYVKYWFKSEEYWNWLNNNVDGSTRANINAVTLSDCPIRYPTSYATQKKIAAVLGAIDDKIETNRKICANLEDVASIYFKHLFGRCSDDNMLLRDFVEVRRGQIITKSSAKHGPVPVIAAGLTPAYYTNKSNANPPVITISASGANAGYVGLHLYDIWASDCSYISRNETPFVYFIYNLLKSKSAEIRNMQKGTAQPHVHASDLMQLGMFTPCIEDVSKFETLVSPMYDDLRRLQKESRALASMRDALLPRLMSGEIDVEKVEVA